MNYVQKYHGQPLTVVYEQDKQDHFNALEAARNREGVGIFRAFIYGRAEKYFKREIEGLTRKQKEARSKDGGMSFLF